MASGRLVWIVALASCGRWGFGDAPPDVVLTTPPRSTLQLDKFDPGELLAAFPVPVVLDDTRLDRTVLAADGSDLRFYDGAGNLIPHELAQLGAEGGAPLLAWVRVPELTPAATIQVDYGHGPPPPASQVPVWNDNYVAVYHFEDSGDPHDSAGGHDTMAFGSTRAPGVCGAARAFDAASLDVLRIPDAAAFGAAELTISGWMYETSLPSAIGYHAMLSRATGTTAENDLWLGDLAGTYRTELQTTGDANFEFFATPATANKWAHLALTVTNGAARFYVDGIQRSTHAVNGAVVHSAIPLYLGADSNAGGGPDVDFLPGSIDEVRIEAGVRTPAWLRTEDVAMRDLLITYGPVGP